MKEYLNRICPSCGGNTIMILSNGSEMCERCHFILPSSNYAHTSDSTSATSAAKYCVRCNTKLESFGDWWICPECNYGYKITTGDPPIELAEEYAEMAKKLIDTPLYIPSGETIGIASVQPQTLTITNCEKFKVQLKEIDLEFELEPDKLENIDTLIINGHKYVKEK